MIYIVTSLLKRFDCDMDIVLHTPDLCSRIGMPLIDPLQFIIDGEWKKAFQPNQTGGIGETKYSIATKGTRMSFRNEKNMAQ